MGASDSNSAHLVDEARSLQREGRLADAERLLQAVLVEQPSNFEALYRIGSIRAQEKRHDEAVDYLQRALAQKPDSADARYNLGIALSALGRTDEATASYREAIAIEPQFAEAHTNLGNLLDAARHADAAIESYRRALAIKPGMAEANYNLVRTLLRQRRNTEASEVLERWLELVPDNEEVRYLYALLSGKHVATRMPDTLVEKGFDDSAANFDVHLQQLGYRAPRLMADALARAAGRPRARLDILDVGCGTGLCGTLVKPHARHLTGVDLSSGMLEAARARGVYDELVKSELTAYLGGCSDAFDAIVAGDVLIYFGPLEPVLRAAHCALRPHGLFIFNVEKAFDHRARDGYRLNPHGRYSHTPSYLRRALAAAGFGVLAIEPATLRTESGRPVAGFVVTCEKVAQPGIAARVRIALHSLRMWLRGAAGRLRRRNP